MADQKPSSPENNPAEVGEPTGPSAEPAPKAKRSADRKVEYVRDGKAVFRVTTFTKGPRKGVANSVRIDGPDGTLPDGVEV